MRELPTNRTAWLLQASLGKRVLVDPLAPIGEAVTFLRNLPDLPKVWVVRVGTNTEVSTVSRKDCVRHWNQNRHRPDEGDQPVITTDRL